VSEEGATGTVETTQATGDAAGAVQPGAGEVGSGSTGQGGNDYIGRVRSDPDYAESQVRQKDRLVNEANQRYKSLEPLEEYVKAAGGVDALLGLVKTGYDVSSNPKVAGFVNDYQTTGKLPDAESADAESEEDHWVDPDAKAYIEKRERALTDRITSLEAQLQQRLAQTDARTYESGIDANIERIMSEYGANDEIKSEISEAITKRVDEARRRAQQGDQQSLNMLSQLSDPSNGFDTFEMMIAKVLLKPENRRVFVQSTESERVNGVAAQSTGEPGGVATAGGGEPVQISRGPNMVREALERRTRMANKSDALWGGR